MKWDGRQLVLLKGVSMKFLAMIFSALVVVASGGSDSHAASAGSVGFCAFKQGGNSTDFAWGISNTDGNTACMNAGYMTYTATRPPVAALEASPHADLLRSNVAGHFAIYTANMQNGLPGTKINYGLGYNAVRARAEASAKKLCEAYGKPCKLFLSGENRGVDCRGKAADSQYRYNTMFERFGSDLRSAVTDQPWRRNISAYCGSSITFVD